MVESPKKDKDKDNKQQPEKAAPKELSSSWNIVGLIVLIFFTVNAVVWIPKGKVGVIHLPGGIQYEVGEGLQIVAPFVSKVETYQNQSLF